MIFLKHMGHMKRGTQTFKQERQTVTKYALATIYVQLQIWIIIVQLSKIPKIPGIIWLVIELDRDIMLTNIFTKFGKDWMKTV